MVLYKLTAPGGTPLLLTLDGAHDDRIEFYVRRGQPPTRTAFDHRSDVTGSDHSILIPNASSGDYYILVYGDRVPSASNYTVRAVASSVYVHSSKPKQYATGQSVTLTVNGAGFVPGTKVQLTRSGATTIAAASILVDSYQQITAVFNLVDVAEGDYDVRICPSRAAAATRSVAHSR